MQTNRKSVAIIYNNSKKIAQLVHRINFFEEIFANQKTEIEKIHDHYESYFKSIQKEYDNQINSFLSSESQIILPSVPEDLKKQYSLFQNQLEKNKNQMIACMEKLDKQIQSKIESLQSIMLKVEKLNGEIQHQIPIEKFNKDFQSRLSRIRKAQIEEIANLDAKNTKKLTQLQNESDKRCMDLRMKYEEESCVSTFLKIREKITQLFIILPLLSKEMNSIEGSYVLFKQNLKNNYMPYSKELRELQRQYDYEKNSLMAEFPQINDFCKQQQNQQLIQKQELLNLKHILEQNQLLHSYHYLMIQFDKEFEQLQQEFINDYQNEFKTYENQKKSHQKLMKELDAQEYFESLKTEKESLISHYSKKPKSIHQTNPKLISENEKYKGTKKKFEEELLLFTQKCQKQILQRENQIEEEEQKQKIALSKDNNRRPKIEEMDIELLEKQFHELESIYNDLLKEDQSIEPPSKNASEFTSQNDDNLDQNPIKKNGNQVKNGKKKKLIKQKENQQIETDDDNFNLEKKTNSSKKTFQSNDTFKKKKEKKNETQIIQSGKKVTLSSKEKRKELKNKPEKPSLISLNLELQSMNDLKETKLKEIDNNRREINDTMKDYMLKENNRHEKRLHEINDEIDVKIRQIDSLEKQIRVTKDEVAKINEMKESFFSMRLKKYQLLDSAKLQSSKNFEELRQKYQREISYVNDKKKDLEQSTSELGQIFIKEKKKLELQLKKVKSQQKESIKKLKNQTNSVFSLRKIEHIDGLEDLQVKYISQKNAAKKEQVTNEEELQMKKSIRELEIKDVENQLKKMVLDSRSTLNGLKGFYDEKESVLRDKLEKLKIECDPEYYRAKYTYLQNEAQLRSQKLSELMKELSNTKALYQKQEKQVNDRFGNQPNIAVMKKPK